MRKLLNSVFYLFLIVVISTACEEDSPSQVTQSELDQLKTEIVDLIADKSCGGVGDCANIAFGSKPCGGPKTWLIFSQSIVDINLLEEKVNTYNELEHRFNLENGLSSDCSVVLSPNTGCLDDICQAIPD